MSNTNNGRPAPLDSRQLDMVVGGTGNYDDDYEVTPCSDPSNQMPALPPASPGAVPVPGITPRSQGR